MNGSNAMYGRLCRATVGCVQVIPKGNNESCGCIRSTHMHACCQTALRAKVLGEWLGGQLERQ